VGKTSCAWHPVVGSKRQFWRPLARTLPTLIYPKSSWRRTVSLQSGINLSLRCVQSDMADLSEFVDESFDLIFHPVSNLFVPDVRIVWRECYRVLKAGGNLLASFMNPCFFLFDHEDAEASGVLTVKYRLPYSEPESLESEARRCWMESHRAAESHSLEAQVAGQLDAGFLITGFYEDSWSDEATPLNRFSPVAIATRATKVLRCTRTRRQRRAGELSRYADDRTGFLLAMSEPARFRGEV